MRRDALGKLKYYFYLEKRSNTGSGLAQLAEWLLPTPEDPGSDPAFSFL